MPEPLRLTINGTEVTVPEGMTVAAAIMLSGEPCRASVSGENRGPLCGMGICYECRAEINGVPHCRSCQLLCEAGMEVKTDE